MLQGLLWIPKGNAKKLVKTVELIMILAEIVLVVIRDSHFKMEDVKKVYY